MSPKPSFHVLFVVQPAFSLLSFSAAADALITANLVDTGARFKVSTLSAKDASVISDLGIAIQSDYQLSTHVDVSANLIMVCGGYRCTLEQDQLLSDFLESSMAQGAAVGGLWNGCVALAHAGLMDGYSAALHPENHAWAKERFALMEIRDETLVVDRNRLTAAGPNSSFDLMLVLIQRHAGIETVNAIRRILKADTGRTAPYDSSSEILTDKPLPARLEKAIALMRNNLGTRLEPDSIASHINISTRAMERLFKKHLNTSPARHYLDLRLSRAHELLQKTDASITEISETCGFISSAHFSRSFGKRFGCTPRSVRVAVSPLIR